MTTPSSVSTMLGLQPRSVVSVQMLLVTFCIVCLLLFRSGSCSSADEDSSDVGELGGPGLAELAPVSGLLDATERQPRVRGRVGVDEERARVDASSNRECAGVVAR